jgi:hypothetical protein
MVPAPAESADDNPSLDVTTLPTEPLMEILEYLSLEQLLLKARLINRIWNTLALDRARKILPGLFSKLRWLMTGNVTPQYHGTRPIVHRAETRVRILNKRTSSELGWI